MDWVQRYQAFWDKRLSALDRFLQKSASKHGKR